MGALAQSLHYSNVTPERQAKEREFALLREKAIRAARHNFWEYNKQESPDFYTESKWHLKLMSWVLQALYEKRLTKSAFLEVCREVAPEWYVDAFDWGQLQDGRIYKKIMMNLPPRIGKSRTLVNFCKWCFGQDRKNKVITGSYNDSIAQDFSRYTRDGISEEKTFPHEIVYADIFPETKIKYGDSSYGKWALEGQFFNYKGAGVGGSVTGKGCNISIVDDPVKDAEEAFNEHRLDVIWTWYSSTFKSRREKGAIEIVNMTRWANKDICGRILDKTAPTGKRADEWFVFKMEAMDRETEEMLCSELLDREMYEELKDTLDESIFEANYHQTPVDKRGRLYKDFRTYTELPKDEKGNVVFEKIIAYGDTADTGNDSLCMPIAGVYMGLAYVLDVLFTKEPNEQTEPAAADMLVKNDVSLARIESNSGGRAWARAVDRLMWERHKTKKVTVKWFHQSKNKQSRIFSNSAALQKVLLFPVDWESRWPEYAKAMKSYKAEGKNANDDAPDATTGLVEMLEKDAKGIKAAKSIM